MSSTGLTRLEPFRPLGREDRRALETEADRLVRWIEPEADRHEVTVAGP